MKPTTEIDRHIFCVDGVPPEQLAYAMTAYSRSDKSFKNRVAHINENNSSEFLEKYYINYGHASIADQAHVPMAIENISILAAMIVVSEPLWDGQERSTRYQDFRETGYLVPTEIMRTGNQEKYEKVAGDLFEAYEQVLNQTYERLKEMHPKPSHLSERWYERTLRARAFDVARYLLPLGTKTSLGQITSARTLEGQISRLLASEYGEVRRIGEAMKQAAQEPAWNPTLDRINNYVNSKFVMTDNHWMKFNELVRPTASAPTLVKYTAPTAYKKEVYDRVRSFLMTLGYPIREDYMIGPGSRVELVEVDNPMDEAIAKLLYVASHLRFKTCVTIAKEMRPKTRKDFLDEVFQYRGDHDAFLNEFRGARFNFDVLMDVGAYRDLHRHRRLTQHPQRLTSYHGYDVPVGHIAEDAVGVFANTVNEALKAHQEIKLPEADYILPLATYCRCLFSMDVAELAYVTELRTKPAGHFSYRDVAYKMYLCAIRRYPELKEYIRVTDPKEGDILER